MCGHTRHIRRYGSDRPQSVSLEHRHAAKAREAEFRHVRMRRKGHYTDLPSSAHIVGYAMCDTLI